MKKIIYFCDKCGKEIKGFHNEVTAVIPGGDASDFEFDLCDNCVPEFLNWFRAEENTPPKRQTY